MPRTPSGPAASSDASSLLTVISSFEFVAALVITRNVLDCTLDVTIITGKEYLDITDGIRPMNVMISDMKKHWS